MGFSFSKAIKEHVELLMLAREHPEWTSEMEIVTPRGNAENNAVGEAWKPVSSSAMKKG